MTTALKKLSIASLIGLSLTALPAMANDNTLGTYGFDDDQPSCTANTLPAGMSFTDQSANCGYNEGLARVIKDGKYGFVDSKGKLVIPATFAEAHPFADGLALIKVGEKYGYIDKTGKTVIAAKFEDAWSFSEGRAQIKQGGKYGFIDTTGKVVIKPSYDATGIWFSEGLISVKTGKKFGFIDKSGKVAIKPQFDSVKEFSEGLAVVTKKSGEKDENGVELHKYGYIDKSGKLVIDFKFDDASDFIKGAAYVVQGKQVYFIDKEGKPTKMPDYTN